MQIRNFSLWQKIIQFLNGATRAFHVIIMIIRLYHFQLIISLYHI